MADPTTPPDDQSAGGNPFLESQANSPDPDAAALEAPLPVAGFTGTPEEIERQWFEQVYTGRGDSMLQLTWRAIIMGSLLGGVLSLTNLYIGLKSGWGFGVAITACILSYSIWTGLRWLRVAKTKMTVLENNCMQSTASSAGYSTGGTLVSAVAAYIIVHNRTIDTLTLMAWVFFLAILGVTMAIPMKRQMINIDQLRFPSGVAAAETLRALHSTGGKAIQSAKALGVAGVLSGISTFWTEGLSVVGSKLQGLSGDTWQRIGARLPDFELQHWVAKFNELVFTPKWMTRTVEFSWQPIFIAAGAITGVRACASMFIGGTLCWAVYVPIMQSEGVINGTGYRELVQWTLWGGAACMVTSGLLSFGFQWRSALRAFKSLGALIMPTRGATTDELDRIETPGSWFVAGQVIGTAGLAYLAKTTFGMPVWVTVVAVLLSFALALVACRVTGETDNTPVGAMGKITQLTFGAIRPGDMTGNLMGACVTAGAADSSSDLLIDLKSGYLLGANPRKQFIAQFCGIFMGTLASVLSFQLIVTGADVLGGDRFPAPAAQAWSAVAIALGKGLDALEGPKIWAMAIGGVVGLILPTLERLFPKQRKWVPSAAAIGLSWTFHWYYSLLFFTGAIIGWIVERWNKQASDDYTFPVASGIIAGGSLMGVAIIIFDSLPGIISQFFAG